MGDQEGGGEVGQRGGGSGRRRGSGIERWGIRKEAGKWDREVGDQEGGGEVG